MPPPTLLTREVSSSLVNDALNTGTWRRKSGLATWHHRVPMPQGMSASEALCHAAVRAWSAVDGFADVAIAAWTTLTAGEDAQVEKRPTLAPQRIRTTCALLGDVCTLALTLDLRCVGLDGSEGPKVTGDEAVRACVLMLEAMRSGLRSTGRWTPSGTSTGQGRERQADATHEPGSRHGRRVSEPEPTELGPLALLDQMAFLELSGPNTVHTDAAMTQLENLTYELRRLPEEYRAELLACAEQMAAEAPHDANRVDFVRNFTSAFLPDE
jgi:hypothetical protein